MAFTGRRLACSALAALVLAASAGSAHAQGRVLGAAGGAPEVAALRVAVALSPGRTTLWASYRLTGPAERAAIVFPVVPGAVVDPASDAWFEALEDATAPRVTPPSGYSPATCGAGAKTGTVDDTADALHAPTLAPSAVAVESTFDDLTRYAASQGLALSDDDQSTLARAGGPFVVLSYDLSGNPTLTQTVRVVEPPTASLSLSLAHASLSAPVPVTLWTIAAGSADVDGADELTPDDLNVAWRAFDATSNYLDARSQALAAHDGQAWLIEASGTTPLYTWTPISGTGETIAPAVTGYLQRAEAIGDISGDPENCQTAIDQARSASGVAAADCPAGLLARVPDPAQSFVACPAAPAGSIDPSELECSGADAVAFALSGLEPDRAWLTRATGWLTDHSAASTQIDVSSSAERSPVVQTKDVDFSGCAGAASGSGGSSGTGEGGSSGSGSPGSSSGYGAYGGSSGGPYGAGGASGVGGPGEYGSGYPDYGSSDDSSSTSVGAVFDCSGSTTPGSSDSSSCSGDSSSSSSDSSSCSGDSSSSDDATCSGDSSSDDGSSCSGDSSSSDDGATCSGDSSSDDGCSLVRPHGHPHVSALGLGFVAIIFPLRRLRGRRRRKATAM
jgi:hypothetical protein